MKDLVAMPGLFFFGVGGGGGGGRGQGGGGNCSQQLAHRQLEQTADQPFMSAFPTNMRLFSGSSA